MSAMGGGGGLQPATVSANIVYVKKPSRNKHLAILLNYPVWKSQDSSKCGDGQTLNQIIP